MKDSKRSKIMKILPTERAMGLVTALSGLAIPIGIVIGAGPLGGASQTVKAFEGIMWVVNPFGMGLFQWGGGLFSLIGLYVVGTMLSALLWGLIDALAFRRKRAGKSL